MTRLTSTGIHKYLIANYSEVRHDTYKMFKAIQLTALEHKINTVALFHLIVENKPLENSHSYGFHTAYGRRLINDFAVYYDLIEPK